MESFSLLSPGFLGLASVAVVVLGLTRGRLRELAFLALNLFFLGRYLLGWSSTAVVVLYALLGFGLIEATRRGVPRMLSLGVAGFSALFVYMQDYEFLHFVLPEALLTRTLVTAGLSFLFFKILHCMIEAHSDTLGRFDLLSYLNYALSFTAFAMGPIQRYPDFRAQWDGEAPPLEPTLAAHLDAVIRILRGLVKAYVLAEWMLTFSMRPGMDLDAMSKLELLSSIYAFNLYLYLNFAGYCDVVIGFGSLMGVRPPENFNLPFVARNVSDFWQRQHRSLTTWLTDYVFTPSFKRLLQSPRFRTRPLLATNLALLLTMFVSGIWHGTTLGFVVFGLLHGLYQVVYRTWDAMLVKKMGKKAVRQWRKQRWVQAVGIVLTFNAVSFAFVFFQLDAAEGFALLWRLLT